MTFFKVSAVRKQDNQLAAYHECIQKRQINTHIIYMSIGLQIKFCDHNRHAKILTDPI